DQLRPDSGVHSVTLDERAGADGGPIVEMDRDAVGIVVESMHGTSELARGGAPKHRHKIAPMNDERRDTRPIAEAADVDPGQRTPRPRAEDEGSHGDTAVDHRIVETEVA